ncbi:hypothetical protein JMUB7535_26940 [Staphylococcus aureus]
MSRGLGDVYNKRQLFPNGGLYIHLDQATERHLPLSLIHI